MGLVIFLMVVCCACTALKAKRDKAKGGGSDGGDGKDGGGGDGATGPENAEVPAKKFRSRGCTDMLCLMLFAAFWMGMMYLLYLGCTVGDPYSVRYGKDYLGNRCGRGNMTNKPKVIFPRIDQDVCHRPPPHISPNLAVSRHDVPWIGQGVRPSRAGAPWTRAPPHGSRR